MIAKILVTGANGYIGSKVVKMLSKMNYNVVATDFSNQNISDEVEFVKADIFSLENPYIYFGLPDICIHLAWRDGFIHNSSKHLEDLSNHYKFIQKMLNSGVKQISIMGTMHEVGYHEGIITNDTPTNPQTLYGLAKDTLRKSLFISNLDKRIIWLRAFYIYGSDSNNPSVFGKIAQAVLDKKNTFGINSGKNKYDFIFVDDLCYQIALASTQTKYKGIINCCSGVSKSLGEMLQEYIKLNDYNIKLEYNKYPDRPYDSPETYGDNTIIKQIMEEYNK